MATMKELYSKAISNAFDAASKIIGEKDKAIAYAEIAKAIATTGVIKSAETVDTPSKEDLKENNAKSKSKAKETAKSEQPAKAGKDADTSKKDDKKEEAAEEEKITEEWTEFACKKFAKEIEQFGKFQEKYDKDSIVQCIEMFSENQYHTLEDINPLNIEPFIAFLNNLETQAETAE